jgi:hypothetical protein
VVTTRREYMRRLLAGVLVALALSGEAKADVVVCHGSEVEPIKAWLFLNGDENEKIPCLTAAKGMKLVQVLRYGNGFYFYFTN